MYLAMQYYQECIALGSKTGISLVAQEKTVKINALFKSLWKDIFLFERRFSRFIPDSELSMFNRRAGTKQSISREFHDLLAAAFKIAEQTKGLFNPFVLPAVQSAGYNHSRVPGHEQDAVDDHSDKAVAAIEQIEIGDNWAKIPYSTAIDFGGCAKGYLGDQLRSQMPDYIQGYWISLGGDISVGGQDKNNRPWTVSVQNADNPKKEIASISADGINAIATSGTNVHSGMQSGKHWHHIIDPATKLPAVTDVILATVCDNSLLNADVLASCAVILGSKQATGFLKKQGAKAGLLQYRSLKGKIQLKYFGNHIILKGIDA